HAKDEATENALAAGADADSVDIVDVEEVPLRTCLATRCESR
ncbi:N-methylhydantoinase A (ATP-hydrolyzing), partial [Haloarcula vallismortis ATCC 29715]